ncbi:MAG: hypothetical protein ACFFCZ_20925 [Promethearchaeota archaeon]
MSLAKSVLHEEFKNAPRDTSLVPRSVSGWLNREATLSATTKYWRVTWAKRTDPTRRCWGQDLRVPARVVTRHELLALVASLSKKTRREAE